MGLFPYTENSPAFWQQYLAVQFNYAHLLSELGFEVISFLLFVLLWEKVLKPRLYRAIHRQIDTEHGYAHTTNPASHVTSVACGVSSMVVLNSVPVTTVTVAVERSEEGQDETNHQQGDGKGAEDVGYEGDYTQHQQDKTDDQH